MGAVERAAGRAWPGVAGRGMDSGSALAAHIVPVLQAGGKVEFSLSRLRDFAAGAAAVRGAALSKLVSAPDSEARKLEGAGIQHSVDLTPCHMDGGLLQARVWASTKRVVM
jgi:hypothetical protein